MGLLDSVLGGSSEQQKYAIILNCAAGNEPGNIGPMINGLEYALELDDAGYEAEVYLDGVATQWPETINENPDHPVAADFEECVERGLVAGACGFCATAFDATEGCERMGIELLSDEDEHAPQMKELADGGYEIISLG